MLIRKHSESLNGVTVRIYSSPSVAGNKEVYTSGKTLHCLTPQEVVDKAPLLLVESKTNDNGQYQILLPDNYDGGTIEIDVLIDQVPFQKNRKITGPQVNLRKLTPTWHKNGTGYYYTYDCRLPFKFWSGIRLQCDAWVIFGYIRKNGGARKPLEKVIVTAYDYDWFTDDNLGVAVTDENGFFRIDYASEDFTKTMLSPLVNIETPISLLSGPGIYFRVADSNGHLLYKENRKVGCRETRKNAHHCFYEEITIDINTKVQS